MPTKSAKPTESPEYEEFVIRVPKTRQSGVQGLILRHVILAVLDVAQDEAAEYTTEVMDRIADYGTPTRVGVIPLYPPGDTERSPIIANV